MPLLLLLVVLPVFWPDSHRLDSHAQIWPTLLQLLGSAEWELQEMAILAIGAIAEGEWLLCVLLLYSCRAALGCLSGPILPCPTPACAAAAADPQAVPTA